MLYKGKIALYIIAGILLQSGCKSQITERDKAPAKPNVIFILADDLGLHDLGYAGSNYYETPNIDGLAQEGAVFTQGYAACRVCSPSRASIMTGKFTARHGITDWIGAPSGTDWRKMNTYDKLLPPEYNHELNKKDITIAEAMKSAGYKTFFAGKWHLGDKGSYPEDHGFDINVGGWEAGSPAGGYFAPWKNPNLENKEDGENLSMRLAKETVEFIKKNRDSSFFAFLSFYAVHGPIQTTQEKWKKYRDKAQKMGIADHGFEMERVLPIRKHQDNPVYAGLVESMDDAVGFVLQELKELGLDDNTIVIFTSDNGGVASGDSYSSSNLPQRGGKGYQWEGGIREPFIIKVPWLHTNGKKIDVPAIGTDFYPTLLDFAHQELLPRQHMDGVSLKPLLEGNSIADRPLYWHYPHYGNQGGEPSSVIRERNWKLIHYWEDDREELYDLQADPGEQNDVAANNPEIKKELSDKLLNWLKDVNANMAQKDPEYDPEKATKRRQWLADESMPRLEDQRRKMLQEDFQPNADWWGSKITID